MKKRWLLLLLLFIPVLCLAQQTGQDLSPLNPLNFNPPPTDVSVNYLADIFGVVDGVLHGSGTQILGHMFSIFNAAVLALGMIVVSYIYLVGTVQTAHEGELLGKKWSSSLIPVKMATGIALLIPKASGYSMIQIFVMWVVIQGIGAADKVWDSALNYIQQGGVIVQQAQSMRGTGALVTNTGYMLQAEVCSAALYNHLQQARQDALQSKSHDIPPVVPDFLDNVPVLGKGSTSLNIPAITSDYYKGYNGVCGRISWNTDTKPAKASVSNWDNLKLSRSVAVRQVYLDLMRYAQIIVSNSKLKTPLPLGTFAKKPDGNPILDQWVGVGTQPPLMRGTELKDSVQDYLGVVFPAQSALTEDLGNKTKFIKAASAQGWMVAGRYYFDLAQVNMAADAIMKQTPIVSGLRKNRDFCKALGMVSGSGACTSEGNHINTLVNSTVVNYNKLAAQFDITYGRIPGSSVVKVVVTLATGSSNPIVKAIYNALDYFGLRQIVEGFVALGTSQETNINPIVSIAQIGSGLIDFTSLVWIGLTLVFFTAAAVAGAVPLVTVSSSVVTAVTWLLPVMGSLLVTLFVAGCTMAFYVPLIPFIVFTFAALGWFIAVIESMIAAPLVALGVAHPEGHEIFGMAQPATMLLTGIFMRPTLIIFGYIVGIILSYVGIWFLNATLWGALWANMLNVAGFAWLVGFVAMLLIWIGLVIAVLNLAFSLIHIIPDKVLRWLSGGQMEQFGQYAKMGEEGAKGALSGGMRAGGQTMQAGMEAGGRKAEEGVGKEQEPGGGITPSSGGGGGGGGGGGEKPTPKPPKEKQD